MDTPRSGETLRGTVTVAGWALSEERIERVAIYIDRNYVSRALLGQARPDVAKVFPNIPNAAISGWITVLNTGSFSQGKHEIIVQARSENGAFRDIGTVPVVFAAPVVSLKPGKANTSDLQPTERETLGMDSTASGVPPLMLTTQGRTDGTFPSWSSNFIYTATQLSPLAVHESHLHYQRIYSR